MDEITKKTLGISVVIVVLFDFIRILQGYSFIEQGIIRIDRILTVIGASLFLLLVVYTIVSIIYSRMHKI